MPNHPSRPQRPGWRNAAQASAAKPKHAWQRGSDKGTAAAKAGSSLRSKYLLLGSAFLTLITIVVVLILLIIPPKDPRIEILVTPDTADPRSPADPYAQRSAEGLYALKGAKLEASQVPLATDSHPLEDVISRCSRSLTSKPAEKVILFPAAPGGADKDGPYWVPADADPLDRSQFLRLDRLLDELGKLDKNTKKLVLVDATQSMAYWPLGSVYNDFTRKLKQRQKDIEKVPNLVFLCASDVGQRSWTSEEWGQSVFMHFVVEGLRGKAKTRSGSIHAWDLYEYVREQVVRWSIHNRAAYQEPILLGGDARAKDMELLQPSPKDSPDFTPKPLDELAAQWEESDKLTRRSPPPWQTAPALWREYLDTMLRYEQLARASADAPAVRQRLKVLRDRLDSETGRIDSAAWTMPGLDAAGIKLSKTEQAELANEFGKLWSAYETDKNADKAREWIRKLWGAGSDHPSDARRNRLLALLVDRAIDAKGVGLGTAGDLAALFRDDGKPMPAEALFLLHIAKNYRQGLDNARVVKALRVRKLAEETAWGFPSELSDRLPAYSEQVRPWISKAVEDGDAARQPGEDLLFASDERSWKIADDLLDKAEKQCTDARQTALAIREAMAARDELMAKLPYYSHWQAERRPDDPGPDELTELESLWQKVHKLDEELAKSTNAQELSQRAQVVRASFDKLKSEFDTHCKKLTEDKSLQSTWHAIEAVLTVPFIEKEQREQLLNLSRSIARRLQEESSSAGRTNEEEGRKQEQDAALILAQRQGRMALAVLGRQWVDDQKMNFDRMKTALGHPEDATRFADEADKLGQLWAALTRPVCSESKKALEKSTVSQSKQALGLLARHARRLDAAGATYLKPDPVAALRRLQWHDWLYWQAQRSLRDHWFYEDGLPYYTVAGDAYVKDALRLASADVDQSGPEKQQRESTAAQLGAEFSSPQGCKVRWRKGAKFVDPPARLDITDEKKVQWVYEITVPNGASPGYVVHEQQAGKWFAPPAEKNKPGWEATPLVGGNTLVHEAKFLLTPQDNLRQPTRPDESKLKFTAFFRGQKVPVETDVKLHRVPDLVWHHRRMPLGAIAVQADTSLFRDFHVKNAELVIVLDASGSMEFRKGGKSRLDRARESLRTVLEQLPQGVRVSLWAFSHKGSRAPERLWALEPWDSAKLAEKMAILNRIEPWGETPLLNSMRTAKQDFSAAGTSKTLVVITDGGDSDVDPNSIPDIVEKEFTKPGIRVRAIGFELEFPPTPQGKREEQGAKKFKEALDKEKGFFPANDARELVDKLRRSMFQMDFLLASAKLDQSVEGEGSVSQLGDNLQWLPNVRPGLYNLQVRFLGQRLSAEERLLNLGPGDCMVVNVRPSEKGLVLQRDLFTKPLTRRLNPILKEQPSANNEWLAAIHENRAREDGSLELMATLEKSVNREPPSNGTLRHFKPRLVLFEARRGGNSKPLPLSFGTLPNYRAPAYSLDVREWGGGREDKTVVDAWWTEPDDVPHNINHPYARILQYEKDFSLGDNFRNVPANLGPGQPTDDKTGHVVLDSVTIEDLDVQARPDGPDKERVSCLVVRLHFPKGKPFLVRVPDPAGDSGDPSHIRFEHRLYYDARKYTGIFPGWTAADLRAGLKNLQLELISLEGLKDPAAGANHVRFELGAPQPGSHVPPKDCLTRFEEK
jgi:Mg-chelatase subunit ChlD